MTLTKSQNCPERGGYVSICWRRAGGKRRALKTLTLSAALMAAALAITPVARAEMPVGNYELQIVGRYDFHTWVWAITPCSAGCAHVSAIPRPIAKGFGYDGAAQFATATTH